MNQYVLAEYEVACVVDAKDKIGEGAFWCPREQAVYWLDVPYPSRVHRLTPRTGEHRTWLMPEMVTAMAKRRDGTLLVASENGLNIFDPATGALEHKAALEPHLPGNRTNDGAPDAKGRFWIGTMQNNLADDGSDIPITAASGSLWRVSPDLSAKVGMADLTITNGVAWSPDSSKLYVVDSMLQQIYVCAFDLETGDIGTRRVFSHASDLGSPDGNAVDEEGCLWSARWEGHCVARIRPDGEIDYVVSIPASRVTSCAFGGENLDTLYVTTSRLNVDAQTLARYPLQGGLFAFKLGVRGLPRPEFGG
jgi:sugar lactone lactonase YvrE